MDSIVVISDEETNQTPTKSPSIMPFPNETTEDLPNPNTPTKLTALGRKFTVCGQRVLFQDSEIIDNKPNPLKCLKCDLLFSSYQQFTKHMWDHVSSTNLRINVGQRIEPPKRKINDEQDDEPICISKRPKSVNGSSSQSGSITDAAKDIKKISRPIEELTIPDSPPDQISSEIPHPESKNDKDNTKEPTISDKMDSESSNPKSNNKDNTKTSDSSEPEKSLQMNPETPNSETLTNKDNLSKDTPKTKASAVQMDPEPSNKEQASPETNLCSECNNTFKSKRLLSNHRPCNSGLSCFTCNLCSKVFLKISSFVNHMDTHDGESDYEEYIPLPVARKERKTRSAVEVSEVESSQSLAPVQNTLSKVSCGIASSMPTSFIATITNVGEGGGAATQVLSTPVIKRTTGTSNTLSKGSCGLASSIPTSSIGSTNNVGYSGGGISGVVFATQVLRTPVIQTGPSFTNAVTASVVRNIVPLTVTTTDRGVVLRAMKQEKKGGADSPSDGGERFKSTDNKSNNSSNNGGTTSSDNSQVSRRVTRNSANTSSSTSTSNNSNSSLPVNASSSQTEMVHPTPPKEIEKATSPPVKTNKEKEQDNPENNKVSTRRSSASTSSSTSTSNSNSSLPVNAASSQTEMAQSTPPKEIEKSTSPPVKTKEKEQGQPEKKKVVPPAKPAKEPANPIPPAVKVSKEKDQEQSEKSKVAPKPSAEKPPAKRTPPPVKNSKEKDHEPEKNKVVPKTSAEEPSSKRTPPTLKPDKNKVVPQGSAEEPPAKKTPPTLKPDKNKVVNQASAEEPPAKRTQPEKNKVVPQGGSSAKPSEEPAAKKVKIERKGSPVELPKDIQNQPGLDLQQESEIADNGRDTKPTIPTSTQNLSENSASTTTISSTDLKKFLRLPSSVSILSIESVTKSKQPAEISTASSSNSNSQPVLKPEPSLSKKQPQNEVPKQKPELGQKQSQNGNSDSQPKLKTEPVQKESQNEGIDDDPKATVNPKANNSFKSKTTKNLGQNSSKTGPKTPENSIPSSSSKKNQLKNGFIPIRETPKNTKKVTPPPATQKKTPPAVKNVSVPVKQSPVVQKPINRNQNLTKTPLKPGSRNVTIPPKQSSTVTRPINRNQNLTRTPNQPRTPTSTQTSRFPIPPRTGNAPFSALGRGGTGTTTLKSGAQLTPVISQAAVQSRTLQPEAEQTGSIYYNSNGSVQFTEVEVPVNETDELLRELSVKLNSLNKGQLTIIPIETSPASTSRVNPQPPQRQMYDTSGFSQTNKKDCYECKRGFAREQDARLHYESCHGPTNLRCSKCFKIFLDVMDLRQHENTCFAPRTNAQVQRSPIPTRPTPMRHISTLTQRLANPQPRMATRPSVPNIPVRQRGRPPFQVRTPAMQPSRTQIIRPPVQNNVRVTAPIPRQVRPAISTPIRYLPTQVQRNRKQLTSSPIPTYEILDDDDDNEEIIMIGKYPREIAPASPILRFDEDLDIQENIEIQSSDVDDDFGLANGDGLGLNQLANQEQDKGNAVIQRQISTTQRNKRSASNSPNPDSQLRRTRKQSFQPLRDEPSPLSLTEKGTSSVSRRPGLVNNATPNGDTPPPMLRAYYEYYGNAIDESTDPIEIV